MIHAWATRGPSEDRDFLINTIAEALRHVEMLVAAVATNLGGAPLEFQEAGARDAAVGAIMDGLSFRRFPSAGAVAMPADAPFSVSHAQGIGQHRSRGDGARPPVSTT